MNVEWKGRGNRDFNICSVEMDCVLFFVEKTAYEMRCGGWSSKLVTSGQEGGGGREEEERERNRRLERGRERGRERREREIEG